MGPRIDVEVGQQMATGRIRRSARRGVAAAVLGWLGVAGVCGRSWRPAPAAAPSATVEIRNVTPPAASVDAGGTVTFVNKIPAQNKGGDRRCRWSAASRATVFTDVAVTFFGQTPRPRSPGSRRRGRFTAPATTGTITYTYRIVPQAGLTAAVANQVVDAVAGTLPALPAPMPYVVQTIAPDLPNLPRVNLPQLPTVTVPAAPAPARARLAARRRRPGPRTRRPTRARAAAGPTLGRAPSGAAYTYGTGAGAPRMAPSDVAAAAAFDPSRFYVPGQSLGGADRAGRLRVRRCAGSYDGASVPVFGQLAGLDGAGAGRGEPPPRRPRLVAGRAGAAGRGPGRGGRAGRGDRRAGPHPPGVALLPLSPTAPAAVVPLRGRRPLSRRGLRTGPVDSAAGRLPGRW